MQQNKKSDHIIRDYYIAKKYVEPLKKELDSEKILYNIELSKDASKNVLMLDISFKPNGVLDVCFINHILEKYGEIKS